MTSSHAFFSLLLSSNPYHFFFPYEIYSIKLAAFFPVQKFWKEVNESAK